MKLRILILVLLVFSFFLAALTPTLISTPLGQNLSLKYLSKLAPYPFSAQKLEVSWLGPQKLEQISMMDSSREMNLECDTIVIKENLFSVALKKVFPQSIIIDNLNAQFNDLKAAGISPAFASILGDKLAIHLQSYLEGNQKQDEQALVLKGILALNKLPEIPYTVNCDIKIEGDLSKTLLVEMHLHNTDGYLSMQGSISEEIFSLAAPFLSEIDINSLLKQGEPKWPLVEIASTENPIKLRIFPEGFQFPLNMDPKNVEIESLELDLGTIILKKQGPLEDIAERLAIVPGKPMSIDFAPIYLSIRDGIAHLKQADFIFMEAYPMSIWGTYNILHDQLNLTLKAPANVLSRLYGLPKIKAKQMITLPITGPLKNPKIDISSLLAGSIKNCPLVGIRN